MRHRMRGWELPKMRPVPAHADEVCSLLKDSGFFSPKAVGSPGPGEGLTCRRGRDCWLMVLERVPSCVSLDSPGIPPGVDTSPPPSHPAQDSGPSGQPLRQAGLCTSKRSLCPRLALGRKDR